jgi:GTP-binding protein Era
MTEKENSGEQTRCGYVAVVGQPNVGKSTLLNQVVGERVAIVTPKPQTTRNRIVAICNRGPIQVVFLDTPGLHDPRGSLGRYMVRAAESAIADADICTWLIDVSSPGRPPGLTAEEKAIAQRLEQTGLPLIVLPNKIDTLRQKEMLLPLIEAATALPGVREVIPIAALKGEAVEQYLTCLTALLPRADKLFPDDILSDQAERFFVAELIREAVTDFTHKEVPYQSAVVVDSFIEETERCVIHATIHVERAGQRGIVVGRGGKMIGRIRERAQEEAERFLRCPVELHLHVEVSPGWTRAAKGLEKMGYK